MGADDYVGAPFSPMVLAARVQAVLRRAASAGTRRLIKLRELTIDPTGGEVRRGDEPVRLTPTEFRMLLALALRAGKIVPPHELLRLAQRREIPEREAQDIVKVHVRHLRHKLEPHSDGSCYIVTVRRMGYMLNQDEMLEEAE
jgi:DNA-binding response OmpR family regulator